MHTFKVGDKVRLKNVGKFSNGEYVATISELPNRQFLRIKGVIHMIHSHDVELASKSGIWKTPPSIGDTVMYRCDELHQDTDSWFKGVVIAMDANIYVIRTDEHDFTCEAYNGFPIGCLKPIVTAAEKLYYKHMDLDPEEYYYMWQQCTQEYRDAWTLIANADEE